MLSNVVGDTEQYSAASCRVNSLASFADLNSTSSDRMTIFPMIVNRRSSAFYSALFAEASIN